MGIDPSRGLELHARRSRPGIGHLLTTLHLPHEREAAELLGILYDEVMQAAMIPVAHNRRRVSPWSAKPLDTIVHWDQW